MKGSSSSIKIGTKVKNIRLVSDSGDGHNIECKIDGFGAMKLKSEVVKKYKKLAINFELLQFDGFEVKPLKAYDNFPMTKHTEVVCLLECGKNIEK